MRAKRTGKNWFGAWMALLDERDEESGCCKE